MSFGKRFSLSTAMEEMVENEFEEATPNIQDETENIDFIMGETDRGFEAISELGKLAKIISKNESKGIATESYSDIAQLTFDSIKKTFGLEDSNVGAYTGKDKDVIDVEGKVVDTPGTMSDRIKDVVLKIIEAIKRLWERIKEFFTEVYNKIKSGIQKTISNLEHFAKMANAGSLGIKTIDIEEPAYFKDKKSLTVDEIFMNSYSDSIIVNIQKFYGQYEVYERLLDLLKSNSLNTPLVDNINKNAEHLDKLLHGKRDNKLGIQVMPEGYITFEKTDGSDYIDFKYQKDTEKITVSKQSVIFSPKEFRPEATINKKIDNLNSLSASLDNVYAEFKDIMDKKIPDILSKLKKELDANGKLYSEDDQKSPINRVKGVKVVLQQLTNTRKTSDSYLRDYIGMTNYYIVKMNAK